MESTVEAIMCKMQDLHHQMQNFAVQLFQVEDVVILRTKFRRPQAAIERDVGRSRQTREATEN